MTTNTIDPIHGLSGMTFQNPPLQSQMSYTQPMQPRQMPFTLQSTTHLDPLSGSHHLNLAQTQAAPNASSNTTPHSAYLLPMPQFLSSSPIFMLPASNSYGSAAQITYPIYAVNTDANTQSHYHLVSNGSHHHQLANYPWMTPTYVMPTNERQYVDSSQPYESISSELSAPISSQGSLLVCIPPMQELVQDMPHQNSNYQSMQQDSTFAKPRSISALPPIESSPIISDPRGKTHSPSSYGHLPSTASISSASEFSPDSKRRKRAQSSAAIGKSQNTMNSIVRPRRVTEVNPYIAYCTLKRAQVRKENPFVTNREILLMVGEMWRRESQDEKQRYERIAREMTARNVAKG
eukprot:TRINITY_DN1963_c0_g1_i2.p1 TRINITY_DN1963_c0_g1~~TRINITY_DN1963_c0_g1_i2.p1  ORF type:complete len:349 (-),score=70.82 TRINITY_DN1963_c0_g1_i2:836-1882(-)